MTDQELNEAVAKKLGWTELGWDSGLAGIKTEYFLGTDSKGEKYQKVPSYSTSIQAAWEIVGKIKFFCLDRESTGEWAVWDMAGTEEAECICKADTAPRAICEAFLKLEANE